MPSLQNVDKQLLKQYLTVSILLLAFGTVNFLILGKPHLCIFRSFCGLPCPGCGLTHAGWAFLQLDWRSSLHYHVLFIPIAVTAFFGCVPPGISRVADFMNRQHWWHWTLVVLSLVYFVIRLFGFEWNGEYPMCYDRANYLYLLFGLFR